jgi:hypothetical protein
VTAKSTIIYVLRNDTTPLFAVHARDGIRMFLLHCREQKFIVFCKARGFPMAVSWTTHAVIQWAGNDAMRKFYNDNHVPSRYRCACTSQRPPSALSPVHAPQTSSVHRACMLCSRLGCKRVNSGTAAAKPVKIRSDANCCNPCKFHRCHRAFMAIFPFADL